jgi:hypothetical protein
MTVSWRRSAEEPGAGGKVKVSATRAIVDVDGPVVADTRAPPVGVSAAPQSPQNLLPDGLFAPHAGQRENSGVPQSPQASLSSGLILPQLGQFMGHPIYFLMYVGSRRFPPES